MRLLDEEEGRFKKAPASFKDAKVADLVKDSVHDARELAVRNAGDLARGRYQRNLADLNEQLRNGQKILIDITAAKRNELDQAMARPAGHRRGVEGEHREARRGARHLAVPRRVLARRAWVLPPDDHVEVREVAMNRVLCAWVRCVGVPAVVLALVLGGGRAAIAATDDGLGGPSTPSSSSSSSSSGPVCVSDQAKKNIDVCPEGPAIQSVPHGKAPAMSFHSKVEDIKKGDKQIGVGTADVAMLAGMRDARQTALKQRALALLVTEIQQLESLLHATENTSSDRPKLLRRLAEDYVELENAAFREKTSAEVARDAAKRGNPRGAAQQQSIADSRKKTMERSRKAAIRYYSLLVDDYSGQPSTTFPQNPPPAYAGLDEVYYYLAYEYEQAGDTANARRVYLDLITKTPNSKYISNAYLAFGELFFNEAQGDPSQVGAREAGLPEGHLEAAARQQGVRLRLVQARVRLLEPGRPAARARRLQEDDRLRDAVRAAPEREEARRERAARTSSRSTRSRAARPTPTTSSRT